jgi:hypothetical protein
MVSFPPERQSILVVHPDTVAPAPVSLESFEPVSGRACQVREALPDESGSLQADRDLLTGSIELGLHCEQLALATGLPSAAAARLARAPGWA